MPPYFWLLTLPLLGGWYCLGHLVPTSAPWRTSTTRLAYTGLVLSWVGVMLPVPWLALHAWLPEITKWDLLLWLILLLGGTLYPLTGWLLSRYSIPALRRGLLWTTDVSVAAWLLYRWL